MHIAGHFPQGDRLGCDVKDGPLGAKQKTQEK